MAFRFAGRIAAAVVAGVTLASGAAHAAKCGSGAAGFQAWLQDFKAEAQAQGISSRTVHAALDGVSYDPRVIQLDRNQHSFKLSLNQFMARRAPPSYISRARGIMRSNAGLLSRIDVAFSRDRGEKVYVQHKLRERGAELFAWLEEGAHLYVCGDAANMAPDVNAALLDVLQQHGRMGPDAAEAYLRTLQRDHRYQRDVY